MGGALAGPRVVMVTVVVPRIVALAMRVRPLRRILPVVLGVGWTALILVHRAVAVARIVRATTLAHSIIAACVRMRVVCVSGSVRVAGGGTAGIVHGAVVRVVRVRVRASRRMCVLLRRVLGMLRAALIPSRGVRTPRP